MRCERAAGLRDSITQMEAQMERSKYINPFITLGFVPVINAIFAGLLLVIFSITLLATVELLRRRSERLRGLSPS